MAQIKTTKTKASVKAYLNAITDSKRRKECKELALMMQEATGEKPAMWGAGIAGFGAVKMKYASGREVDWMQIGFSSRKDAISLYLMCDLDEATPLLEKLGAYKRGVGCLYIKTFDDIHLPTIKKLIAFAVKMAKKNSK